MLAKIFSFTLCILISFSLCACNVFSLSFDNDSLLMAPKLNKQQAEVSSLLESSLSLTSIQYKYPQTGQYRSPFIFFDMDGDSREEAIIFYCYKDDATSIRAKILTKDAVGQWGLSHDISASGDQVDFVRFENILDRQAYSLVIGWKNTRSQSKPQQLGVYSIVSGGFRPEILQPYSHYSIWDTNGDGLSEIVTISKPSASRPHTLSLQGSSDSRLMDMAEWELSLDTDVVLQLSHGLLWDGKYGVFIDQARTDGTISTEIIRIANQNMELVAGGNFDESTKEQTVQWQLYEDTFRDENILCADIDGDGSVEVPKLIALSGIPESDDGTQMQLTQYMGITENSFSIVKSAVTNSASGYLVFFPDSWIGQVTIVSQPETNEWIFFKFSPDTLKPTIELLRVRTDTTKNAKALLSDGYILLATKGVASYFMYIPKTVDEPLAVTAEQAKPLFALL